MILGFPGWKGVRQRKPAARLQQSRFFAPTRLSEMTQAHHSLTSFPASLTVDLALDAAPVGATPSQRVSADSLFFRVFAAAAALKLLLAAVIPLTGDEAYFVVWGRFLDYGYYDHGAMIGWWLWLAVLAGDSAFLLRRPAVATPLVAALILRRVLHPVSPPKANLVAIFFLLSPVVLLNVLITPESPLLLFSLLAGAFAIRAVRRERVADWAFAGFFLGLAFLAKYLALLLGVGF